MKYLERVEVDNDILTLATKYIEEKVVGQTSFDDCIHIATATIHKADILASWNFKHIVNIYRIRGYNSINLRMNYPSLEIRSPKEITDTVTTFRKIKEQISNDLTGKSFEQIKEYLRVNSLKINSN